MLPQSVGRHLPTVGKQLPAVSRYLLTVGMELLRQGSPGSQGCCMRWELGLEQVQLHCKQEEDWVEGVLLLCYGVDWVPGIHHGEQVYLLLVLLAILLGRRRSRRVVLLAEDLRSQNRLRSFFGCGTFACCSLYCSL